MSPRVRIPPMAAALAVALSFAPRAADAAQPTLMVLNVAVDITGVTGDDGTFTVACRATQGNDVKGNFLDGHTTVQFLHDSTPGGYVAHYQGPVTVDMSDNYPPPRYDFAKLDSYYCDLAMTADGLTTQPAIAGPLPKGR